MERSVLVASCSDAWSSWTFFRLTAYLIALAFYYEYGH